MIEVLPPFGKYKYNTWRILPVKCYIDNSVRLRSCIRNDNRVIMAFMCVSLVELLLKAMEWIPALEYMLSGARGLLRPHLVVPGAKCHRFLRPQC
jgi:hypothetical protein